VVSCAHRLTSGCSRRAVADGSRVKIEHDARS
jgi:hypothetical protein